MAITLTFDELVAEAAETPGIVFITKEGAPVTIRPPAVLGKDDIKAVRDQMRLVTSADDDTDPFVVIDAMDDILATAADDPAALRASLDALPLGARKKIFTTWAEATELPESSSSPS